MNAPLPRKRHASRPNGSGPGIEAFDHLEFYVGNAQQAASYYAQAFGFEIKARRGLENGYRDAASYVLQQGRITFVLTSPLHAGHPAGQHISKHGDGVGVLALRVADVDKAFSFATARGAAPHESPYCEEDKDGQIHKASVRLYGDTVLTFVQRNQYQGVFAPGFEVAGVRPRRRSFQPEPVGLVAIDHVVANVAEGQMDPWAKFFADTLDFSELTRFDENAISTQYSALKSVVMRDRSGRVKLPINEPAKGKRQSQISEYLQYNGGPGIQHIAMATGNIVETVGHLRKNGVQFLQVPEAYYEDLEQRVGPIDEAIVALADLGILVDRDEDGYLLQIFTQPVQDRPTLFFEIIQRRGCQGFGEGNFKALFESIEREQQRRGNL